MTDFRSSVALVMLCLFVHSLPSQEASKTQGQVTCTAIGESKDPFYTDPNHGYVLFALALPKNAEKLSITAHVRLPDFVNAPGGSVMFVTGSRSRFGKRWLDCELGSFCVWGPIPGMAGMETNLMVPHADSDGTQRYEVTFSGNGGGYFPVVRLALTYTMPGPFCRVEATNAALFRKASTTTELLIPGGEKILEWSDFVAPAGSDKWKKCDDEKTANQCGHEYEFQSGWFAEPDKSDGAHGRLWSCGNNTDRDVFCRMDLKYDPNPADSGKNDQEKQDVP